MCVHKKSADPVIRVDFSYSANTVIFSGHHNYA